jgi:hypothetical protein
MEGETSAQPLVAILREKRIAADRQRKHAAIERERLLVLEILLAGPATTREISAKLGLTPDRTRLRAHQIDAVLGSDGRWRLGEGTHFALPAPYQPEISSMSF